MTLPTLETIASYLTILAAIAGALLAAVVAGGLAVVVLIPPWSHLLGLGGESDGLLLMGLPVFALPGVALGGLVFGCIWRSSVTGKSPCFVPVCRLLRSS